MMVFLILMLVIYVLLNIITPIVAYGVCDGISILPHELKDTTNMNWFGCVCTCIFLSFLLPLIFVAKLIYFLFHIGTDN